jgi:hypothetical protein
MWRDCLKFRKLLPTASHCNTILPSSITINFRTKNTTEKASKHPATFKTFSFQKDDIPLCLAFTCALFTQYSASLCCSSKHCSSPDGCGRPMRYLNKHDIFINPGTGNQKLGNSPKITLLETKNIFLLENIFFLK